MLAVGHDGGDLPALGRDLAWASAKARVLIGNTGTNVPDGRSPRPVPFQRRVETDELAGLRRARTKFGICSPGFGAFSPTSCSLSLATRSIDRGLKVRAEPPTASAKAWSLLARDASMSRHWTKASSSSCESGFEFIQQSSGPGDRPPGRKPNTIRSPQISPPLPIPSEGADG